MCIERRAVSEPSSPTHPFLHLSFSLSDISPFSSNHFLPFGPLLFLMQLSLIPSFLPLSLFYFFHPSLPIGTFLFYFVRFFVCAYFSSFSIISTSHVLANNSVSTIVSCTYCSSLFALTWLSPLFCSLAISLP